MNMICKFAAVSAAVLLPMAAHAQDAEPSGFYLALDAGIAKLSDADITYYDAGGTFGGTGTEDTFDGNFDFKSAATFGGAIGYDFGTVRTDLEISYARNKVSSFTIEQVNGQAVTLDADDRADACDYLEVDTCGGSGNTFVIDGSRARQLNAMANLWLDLPLGVVTPYVGGGVGIAGFEVDGEGKGKFAWQVGAGAAVNLSPNFSVTADLRHRQVSSTRIEWDAVSGLELGKLKTQTFTIGIRAYL